MNTEIYDVTPLVGNQGTEGEAVDRLVRLIYRTVDPEGWFALGGVGTIRPLYNPVRKKWYLSVFSAVPRAAMQGHLAGLNA